MTELSTDLVLNNQRDCCCMIPNLNLFRLRLFFILLDQPSKSGAVSSLASLADYSSSDDDAG